MEKLKALNRKQIKEILNKLKELYSIKELKLDYIFFKNSKGKIFLLSNKFKDFENEIHINSLGLYFATINREIRLSIEGSQLIGKKAKKNILELSGGQLRKWLMGEDIEIKSKGKGFFLIKNKGDFFGNGKVIDNKLLNFVPKDRRINVI